MGESDILLLYLQHGFKTETESGIGTFDNTLVANLLDADIGFPLTSNEELITDHFRDEIDSILFNDELTTNGGYPKISSSYNEDFCITSQEGISDKVKLVSGRYEDIDSYDVLIVSHFWAYTPLINNLSNNFPNKTLIGIQEGAIQDVFFYSSGLQLMHRDALASLDGYIAENEQYEQYVREFVDEVIRIPLLVPKNQFESTKKREKKPGKICIGVTTWNIDFSNFYTNVLVIDALRNRGHDVTGEIVGVKDYQKKMVGKFDNLPFVNTIEFIDEGFYDKISEYKLAVLLTTRATAGRVSAEFAGVGTPVIGNQHNDLQKRCFPDLSIEPHDINLAVDLAEKMLVNMDYYEQVQSRAEDTISDLENHEKTKRKILDFIQKSKN